MLRTESVDLLNVVSVPTHQRVGGRPNSGTKPGEDSTVSDCEDLIMGTQPLEQQTGSVAYQE